MKLSWIFAVIMTAMTGSFAMAGEVETKTVDQVHPGLAVGVLVNAKITELPEGVVLRADGIEITESQITAAINKQPAFLHDQLEKNAFFVLEQESTEQLLKHHVTKYFSEQGKDISEMNEQQMFGAYFDEFTKDITVSDADVEQFYNENTHMFQGAPLDSVKTQLQGHILQLKKQQAVDDLIGQLGRTMVIEVSKSWTAKMAEQAADNLIDKARQNGKATIAIFSGTACQSSCGTDVMAEVVNPAQRKYSGKVNIVSINIQQNQILAARFGIRTVPTVFFFDSDGREFYRKDGQITEQEIAAKLSEMGVI